MHALPALPFLVSAMANLYCDCCLESEGLTFTYFDPSRSPNDITPILTLQLTRMTLTLTLTLTVTLLQPPL